MVNLTKLEMITKDVQIWSKRPKHWGGREEQTLDSEWLLDFTQSDLIEGIRKIKRETLNNTGILVL